MPQTCSMRSRSEMIDVTPAQYRILMDILDRCVPNCTVWAFGSRFRSQGRPSSDLDLVLLGPDKLPLVTLGELREALEESDLPFTVDLSDWNRLSPSFQSVISAGYEVLREA